jgi:photosystem II stability/assembly factor-like uncharacterized protein
MNRPVVAILIDWRTLVLSLALVGAFLLSFCIDPAEARVEDNPTVAARSHMADKAESALLVGATCVGDVVLVSGNHGLILRSADGGKTYQQIEAPTRRMLTAIILDAQGTAFAVGHDTTVLRSRDSGLSWQSVYCDPEADLGLFSIQAIGDSRVVAVGAFGTLLISDDGGDHWKQELISEDGPHLYSLQKSAERLVVTGEFGSIFESRDGGDVWTALESPYDGTFFHVMIDSPDSIIVMGLRGNLWEGHPGRWKRIDSGSEAALFGGCRVGTDEVIVVGDEGRALHRSADGNWSDVSPGERRIISTAILLPDGNLLFLGDKGYRNFDRPSPVKSQGSGKAGQ